MVAKYKQRLVETKKEMKLQRGKIAETVYHETELKQVFLDALEKTKLQIFKRRLRAERGQKK
jgi:hypothetical protein